MKFRNKETGEVFKHNSDEFCHQYDTCFSCPIGINVNGIIGAEKACVQWTLDHPEEAAELMGYELVSENDYPPVGPVGPIGPKGPEAKSDAGKPRPTLVPVSLMEAVTAVREYGCAKYHDPENWRRVEPQRYRDALYRHWLAYLKGEKTDPESGLPHLWHLATNAAFLIEMEQEAKENAEKEEKP